MESGPGEAGGSQVLKGMVLTYYGTGQPLEGSLCPELGSWANQKSKGKEGK